MINRLLLAGFLTTCVAVHMRAAQGGPEPSVAGYKSIQEATDANPGRMVWVPVGDYPIADKLRIRKDGSGLFGPGRIIQTNPKAPIIEIENAAGVRIQDLRLTRPEGAQETDVEGVLAIGCQDLSLVDLQVCENRTRAAAISLRDCVGGRIRGCLVRNYMRITVDDRTASNDWGYAFACIDGSGIVIRGGKGILISDNRIIERDLLPTPQIQQKHNLGRFVKKNPVKGELVSQQAWDQEWVSNWHQGSAIVVTSPEESAGIRILGNHIENAAQGIDLHADQMIVSQNVVNNAFMGMKAMHGSRHVLIIENQFIKNDLWAIGLMPGAASHAAGHADAAGKPAPANIDGGSIIANNIISEFGYGHAHWIWGNERSPFKFDSRQKPHNPPLTDVIVQGNIVYDTGRDGVVVDGKAATAAPRYKYAVILASEPRGIRFSNNLFHPGTAGVANVELKP